MTISKVKCTSTLIQASPENVTTVEQEQEIDHSKIVDIENETSDGEAPDTGDETNQIIEYYEEYLNDFDQPIDDLEVVEKESESLSPIKPTATTSTLTVTEAATSPPTKSTNKPTVVKMLCEASFVCMTCKINVNTFEELRIHMKTNVACKKINLTCETCGKCCDSKKSLYQHTLTHKQKSSFVCEECGKIYTNRFNLENHKS